MKNAIYFKIVDIMMKILKNVYEDLNRQRNARQKYLALKQRINQKFASFFFEFVRLSHELKYIDAMLRQDLETKINQELKSILVNNSQKFDNLSQIKDYLIIANNVRRRIKINNDRKDIFKKNKTTNKSRYTTIVYNDNRVSIYSRTIITIAKLVVAISISIILSLANVQDFKRNNCFVCHKYEHLAKDYSNKESRVAIIKELQLDSKFDKNHNLSLEN